MQITLVGSKSRAILFDFLGFFSRGTSKNIQSISVVLWYGGMLFNRLRLLFLKNVPGLPLFQSHSLFRTLSHVSLYISIISQEVF